MSAILRLIGALALLASSAVALPHPDIIPSATITSVVDTTEPSATGYVTPPASTPTPTSAPPPTTTPPPAYTPSTHSLATGEAPYEGTCDWGYCNSLGLSVCAYWGGITGWNSYHQPLPGETFTTLGPCSTASAETTGAEMVTTAQANATTTTVASV
ncbi:hypothetical protein Hte_011622 [Hypoxylon texense]